MVDKTRIGIDELATFCKRKGFVYPSGEIYGGLAGFWDFGPLGVELVNNLKRAWWAFHVHNREDVAGIDGSIISNPKVWEASGHVGHFVDYLVRNKKTGELFKVDAHEVEKYKKDPHYIVEGTFNPMFTTTVGPSVAKQTTAYLRPETAQSIFSDFKSVYEHARLRLPCGIAQIGKAFRNEIAPREFLFRSREFEQMELEYFVEPGTKCPYVDSIKGTELALYTEKMQHGKENAKIMDLHTAWKKGVIKSDWHAYWIAQEVKWFESLGVDLNHFRARQHTKDEKSHYAVDTWDLEYEFPMGWRELEGIANRGTYDLTSHEKASKQSFAVLVDDVTGKKVVPEVVCEPSLGVGRAFIVFLLEAYHQDLKRENVVLKLHPRLAPYQAAVFPLISKDKQLDLSEKIKADLNKEFHVFSDLSGSIGRRYARNDEMGTPFCITIDEDSLKKKTVTIRDRDTTKQISVKIADLKDVMRRLVNREVAFEKAGKLVETRVK